jgi:hypothetical protein
MTDSRDCGPCFCNLHFETCNSGLRAVLLSWLVSELQKSSSPGLEPHDDFPGFRPLFLYSLPRQKQLCSWRRSSIVFSSGASGTTFAGTRTHYIVLVLWPF